MSSGVISDLIARGHIDKYLSVNPSVSFWRYRHARHTPFAAEGVSVQFSTNSNIGSGAQSSVIVPRNGDLISRCYLVVELPGIANVSASTHAPHAGTPDAEANRKTKSAANDDTVAGYVEAVEETLHDTYLGLRSNRGLAGSEMDGKHTVDNATVTGEAVPYWSPSIGHIILKEAKLQFGGSTVDNVYGELAFMMEELGGRPGKELTELVGKGKGDAKVADLKARSKFYQRLYVPMPFFFTQHSGVAIQLVAMAFHDVSIRCDWRDVSELVVNGSGLGKGTSYLVEPGGGDMLLETIVRKNETAVNTRTNGALDIYVSDAGSGTKTRGTLLTNSHVKVSLELEYIYLSNDERNFIADSKSEKLIMTSQTSTQVSTRESDIIRKLNFNHACTEIIFAIRQKWNENRNDWANFDGCVDPLTSRAQDPVREVSLLLNNHARFERKRHGSYFRTVVPYQSHNRRPDAMVYCYSFARDADSIAPTGSINMSRIDSCELVLGLDPALFSNNTSVSGKHLGSGGDVTGGNSVMVLVYARSFNILKQTGGVAGLGFTM